MTRQLKVRSVFLVILLALGTGHGPCETLLKVLADNGVSATSLETPVTDKNITSYAVLNDPGIFCIAYYLDNASECLGKELYTLLFNKKEKSWLQGVLDVTKLTPEQGCVRPGSVTDIAYSGNYIYLQTHINPSAGATLVLSNRLLLHDIVYGWPLAIFADETVVYHNNQIHFAPTHYAQVSVYNPRAKSRRKIYPMKPYQNIRLAHIRDVKAAYDKLGEDWFRCHNHHMNPELFNNYLDGAVAINDETNSLAFVIGYDNKDCWDERDTLRLESFRELHQRLKQFPAEAPLSDFLFMSLYEDLARIKRLYNPDRVLELFQDDKQLQGMLQVAFGRRRQPGENWRSFFDSLDPNWEDVAIWQKIARTIAARPEYTKVVHIYRNPKASRNVKYKEILQSDLTARYPNLSLEGYLKPKVLREIFSK